MFSPDIKVAKDPGALTAIAANLFVDIGRESIAINGAFTIALSGGSTPRRLYSLLAANYRNSLDWSKVTFFIGDERNVPADAEESNYRMARETLLEPLTIDADRVHRWQTELDDINDAAAKYELELTENFERSKRGFDLILLGLGADAHTASLFPRTAALNEFKRLAVANRVEQLNDYRLTITFPVINNAASVVFLVAGGDKSDAVSKVLEGERRPNDFPAQHVRPERGTVRWLLDEAAASRLNHIRV